jgi:hypothetical protein
VRLRRSSGASGDPESRLAGALPDAFRKADEASGAAQRRFLRLTLGFLLVNVVAAVLGGPGLSGRADERAALVATGLFVVGLMLTSWLAIERPNRRWYAARAAAESAKTLAVQYGVGGGSFKIGLPAIERDYRRAIASIPDALDRLPPLGDLGDAVTPGLAEIRALPLDERRHLYLRERIADQRAWYVSQARTNDLRAMGWRTIMFAGQLLGIGGGFLRVWGVWDVNLLGIAAALTASAAAWIRTKDHEGLAEAYAITQRELGKVEIEGARPTTEAEWAEFVADAESAVSREHTLWLARRIG